jgi:hypothetical protein
VVQGVEGDGVGLEAGLLDVAAVGVGADPVAQAEPVGAGLGLGVPAFCGWGACIKRRWGGNATKHTPVMLLNEQLDRRGKPKGVSKPLSYYVFSAMLKEAMREFYRCPHWEIGLPRHYNEEVRVINDGTGWSVAVGLFRRQRVSQWVFKGAFETVVHVTWVPHDATRVTDAEDEAKWVDTPDIRTAVEAVVRALTA